MKRVSLAKISEAAGVSVGTVSRVLSGKAEQCRISKETAEKIIQTARDLNYSPIHVVKNLQTEQKIIGLIIPSLKPFFAEIASILIAETEKMGFVVVISNARDDEKEYMKSISAMIKMNVDGLLVVPCSDTPMWLEQIDKTLFPVVLIDRYFEDSSLSYVTSNNFNGATIAVNYFIKYGHKNIACLQGLTSSMPNRERVRGYVSAMENAGLGDYVNISGDAFTVQNGYLMTKSLLSQPVHPTALFALANTIFLGSIKAIREAGLRIPEDISVISFDDFFYLDYMEPPITRVKQSITDICTVAVKILAEKIYKVNVSQRMIQLNSNLIEGESVARIKD